jgi:hypothetical protein
MCGLAWTSAPGPALLSVPLCAHIIGGSLGLPQRTGSAGLRSAGLRVPGALFMQPLNAHCMRMLLRFWMGAHPLPVVMGRHTGIQRDQRLVSAVQPALCR